MARKILLSVELCELKCVHLGLQACKPCVIAVCALVVALAAMQHRPHQEATTHVCLHEGFMSRLRLALAWTRAWSSYNLKLVDEDCVALRASLRRGSLRLDSVSRCHRRSSPRRPTQPHSRDNKLMVCCRTPSGVLENPPIRRRAFWGSLASSVVCFFRHSHFLCWRAPVESNAFSSVFSPLRTHIEQQRRDAPGGRMLRSCSCSLPPALRSCYLAGTLCCWQSFVFKHR